MLKNNLPKKRNQKYTRFCVILSIYKRRWFATLLFFFSEPRDAESFFRKAPERWCEELSMVDFLRCREQLSGA
jgi:hypothetical protein